MTWDKLAAELGINLRTLHELRAEEHAPALPSPVYWRKWLAKRDGATGRRPDAADSDSAVALADDGDARPSMPALKAAKIREEIRKLSIVNDIRDKRLQEKWRQAGIDAASSILRRVRGGLMGLLPSRLAASCAGKTGSEIELIVRREVEAVLEESLHSVPETAPEPAAV